MSDAQIWQIHPNEGLVINERIFSKSKVEPIVSPQSTTSIPQVEYHNLMRKRM